jgi:hypothetical protein
LLVFVGAALQRRQAAADPSEVKVADEQPAAALPTSLDAARKPDDVTPSAVGRRPRRNDLLVDLSRTGNATDQPWSAPKFDRVLSRNALGLSMAWLSSAQINSSNPLMRPSGPIL